MKTLLSKNHSATNHSAKTLHPLFASFVPFCGQSLSSFKFQIFSLALLLAFGTAPAAQWIIDGHRQSATPAFESIPQTIINEIFSPAGSPLLVTALDPTIIRQTNTTSLGSIDLNTGDTFELTAWTGIVSTGGTIWQNIDFGYGFTAYLHLNNTAGPILFDYHIPASSFLNWDDYGTDALTFIKFRGTKTDTGIYFFPETLAAPVRAAQVLGMTSIGTFWPTPDTSFSVDLSLVSDGTLANPDWAGDQVGLAGVKLTVWRAP